MASITTRVTSGTGATVKSAPLTNAEIDTNFINLNSAIVSNAEVSKDLTGFPDTTTSSIAFDETTRTLTLAPTGASFTVYFRGTPYTISSSKTLQISNTSGGRYIIYDYTNGVLLDVGESFSPSTTLFVAYIYWDATAGKAIIFGDERHLASRDTTWHSTQHTTIGALWKSGGTASYTLNNGNLINFGLTTPIALADEELDYSVVHSGNPVARYEQNLNGSGYFPILYLSGTTYKQTTPALVPWLAGTSRASYNPVSAGSGSLADTPTEKFIVYWCIATNDTKYPIKMVIGRNYYDSQSAADTTESFEGYGLPLPEIVPMYKIILKVSDTYTQNTQRVNIVSVKEILGQQNRRFNSFDGLSHSSLSSRFAADQHTIAAITGLQAALDLKLNSADITYTAADVLNKIKTVDGAGSGLDADLLDGKSSGEFWENNSTWVGTNFPGTLYKGAASNSGAVAAIQDSPVAGKMSWLIDGSYYAAETGGYYSMVGQDYTTRKGWYTDGTSCIWNSHVIPTANNTYNLGSATMGWANVYTNDLHLSNMNKEGGNDIDHTNGNWTIQEGEEVLYIINNRNGKKYKFKLEEV